MDEYVDLRTYSQVEDELQVGPDATPLEFLQAFYRNPALPVSTRLRAAGLAAPFVHPKFSVVVGPNDPRQFADELERRIRHWNEAKLIEHQPSKPNGIRRI
jgi:hypothetical protein